MVVTRQGTVTSPDATASGSTGSSVAVGLGGRNPRRATPQKRAPSAKKRGGGYAPTKEPSNREEGLLPSLKSPQSGGRVNKAKTPRVQLADKAQVIGSIPRSSRNSAQPKERGLVRTLHLTHRLQTGPLPFVKEMSNMSSSENEKDEIPLRTSLSTTAEWEPEKLPAFRQRRQSAAIRAKQSSKSTYRLGGVDTAFLGAYAVSQLLLAPALLGGSRGPSCTVILAAAYAISACSCFCIYLLPDAQLSPLSLSCLWGINGASQALAFPLIVSTLSSWLSSTERGGVLGVWTTCQQVGSIFASYLTAELLATGSRRIASVSVLEAYTLGGRALLAPGVSGWRLAFLVPAIWVFFCAMLLGWGLKKAPGESDFKNAATRKHQGRATHKQEQQQWLLRKVLDIGSIRHLCAAYFCVKLVRYSLLYWLPYYLEKHANLTASAAAFYCIYFDAGGVFGSVAVGWVMAIFLWQDFNACLSDGLHGKGHPRVLRTAVCRCPAIWLSDRYLQGRRLLLLAPLCCIGGASVALLHLSVAWAPPGDISLVGQGALLLAGAAIAAPDSVLGGAATADACADEPGGADEQTVAAAACVVNGFGSVGSIVQGLLTPILLSHYGWSHVFYSLAGTAVLGGFSLIPGAFLDIQVLLTSTEHPYIPTHKAVERGV
ncbi:putative sugar permease [Cyclospora cayetanensis]|uniref:Sugar permease n=1 Tax=Cyclospora cayetanensis TaxID=88456 RepID=A0A1D3D335_9EIME|nr:putative sugar permease [Cyclospora cayetanensis]